MGVRRARRGRGHMREEEEAVAVGSSPLLVGRGGLRPLLHAWWQEQLHLSTPPTGEPPTTPSACRGGHQRRSTAAQVLIDE